MPTKRQILSDTLGDKDLDILKDSLAAFIATKNTRNNEIIGPSIWRQVIETLPEPQRRKIEGLNLNKVSDVLSDVFNHRVQKAERKVINESVNDPFLAISRYKGDQIGDVVLAICKKAYFQTVSYVATRHSRGQSLNTTYFSSVFLGKFSETLREKLPGEMFDLVFNVDGQSVPEPYIADVINLLQFKYKTPEDEERLMLAEMRTPDGLIRAVPLDKDKISDRGTASHAKGVASWETQNEAQSKNPKPRVGNSGDKAINRGNNHD